MRLFGVDVKCRFGIGVVRRFEVRGMCKRGATSLRLLQCALLQRVATRGGLSQQSASTSRSALTRSRGA